MKQSTSFHLSHEGLRLLKELSSETGLSQAGCLELAIRALARREGITMAQSQTAPASEIGIVAQPLPPDQALAPKPASPRVQTKAAAAGGET